MRSSRELGCDATTTECKKSNPTTTTKKANSPIFQLDGYLTPLQHPQLLSSLGLKITSYAVHQSGFQRTACQKNGQASNINRGQECQYNNAKQF